jgi:hypothetical protein
MAGFTKYNIQHMIEEIITTALNGISVSDIRVKITDEQGNISYTPIRFSKKKLKMCNLIHKDGVETILEVLQNKLGILRNLI